MLRRLLSIFVFGAMLLPVVLPVLSYESTAGSGLPACCRRNGIHHCAMTAEAAEKLVSLNTSQMFRSLQQRCPYQERVLGAVHHEVSIGAEAAASDVALLREPSLVARAECLRRISFDRSRQKRGPPVVLS